MIEYLYKNIQSLLKDYGASEASADIVTQLFLSNFKQAMKGDTCLNTIEAEAKTAEEKEIIEVNGMQFQKTRLLPNFQGVYDSDPCPECHLDIHWVDYGGVCMCGKIVCARTNRKDPYVWTIVGGMDALKSKNR